MSHTQFGEDTTHFGADQENLELFMVVDQAYERTVCAAPGTPISLRRLRERFDEPHRNVSRRRCDMRDDSAHLLA
jgi:hypothetical protein